MKDKIIYSFLIWVIGVWVIFLLKSSIYLSEIVSEKYSEYIFIFIAMTILWLFIEFAPDSENKNK